MQVTYREWESVRTHSEGLEKITYELRAEKLVSLSVFLR